MRRAGRLHRLWQQEQKQQEQRQQEQNTQHSQQTQQCQQRQHQQTQQHQKGFSLVEIAIVLIILGVLTRGAIGPLAGMIEQSSRNQTELTLERVRKALIGHVIATGSLPCPQPLNSDVASLASDDSTACRRSFGAVPGNAIGVMGEMNADGLLVDAWGRPLHYVVSLANHVTHGNPELPDWTTPGEPAAVGIASLTAGLGLCAVMAAGDCPRRQQRAGQVVVLVYSLGADASVAGDQGENQDDDAVFVTQPVSRVAGQEFDDQLIWISRSELHYWLLRAAWLP
jgi:prepilin-type N-terminal cleavage/methylation domain-containing protein